MNLSERLKRVREHLGHDQKKMADLLSISFRSWQDYELGKSVPGGKVFESLSRLGINANWLLTGEGSIIGTELVMHFDILWGRIQKVTGFNYEKFASFIATSPERISKAKSKGQMPLDWAMMVAKEYNVSLDWLVTGEGPMKREEKGEGRATSAVSKGTSEYGKRVDDKYCYIPLYDVKAAAGNGTVIDREHIVDFLAFKQEWIRVQLGLSPQDLYLIHVDGESMEPTLRPGDMILIDHRTASSLPRDGIYVLRMDDTLLVKRLQRLPGSVVKVTSDNPAYEPFTLDLKQSVDEVGIIGRVVWCGRRM